jgi:hypothetical protein
VSAAGRARTDVDATPLRASPDADGTLAARPAAVPDATPPAAPTAPDSVPAPARRDPLWFAPLFVLAPARTYSTVVNTMIGTHPQMFAFPELALFRRATIAELTADPAGWRGPAPEQRLAGLLRALAQANHGSQTAETIGLARHWLAVRGGWHGEDVYDHLLTRVAPLVAAQKSPEDSGRDEYLARAAAAYPRARFLHLTRHPVTSVTSMHDAWKDLDYWNVARELFHNFCIGVWYHHHLRIDRFVSALPPDRGLRVRSEDVLNDPDRTLPEICAWLGIDSSPASIDAMRHPERSPYARLGPPGAMGGGDGAFMRDPVPRAAALRASLDVPPDWGIDPWLLTATIELAYRFGYQHRSEADVAADAGA